MPHVRERQPFPEEPTSPDPGGTTSDEPTTGLADLETDQPRTPGRVDAGEAVTGDRAGSSGEAAPGGIPGDDSSLEGGDPV
jgi:hypothetical protein